MSDGGEELNPVQEAIQNDKNRIRKNMFCATASVAAMLSSGGLAVSHERTANEEVTKDPVAIIETAVFSAAVGELVISCVNITRLRPYLRYRREMAQRQQELKDETD